MELLPAGGFSTVELTQFFNLGYTGYLVPINFTEGAFANWQHWGGLDLDRSLIMMDRDLLVGFSFAGIRSHRSWIGGFGVSPEYRGRGVSSTDTEPEALDIRNSCKKKKPTRRWMPSWRFMI